MTTHTAIATDNFNRGDGALGANWTNSVPQNDLLIASNVVKANSSVDNNVKFWNNGTFSVNQYGQVKISTAPSTSGAWMGPAVRVTATDAIWLQCTNTNGGLEMIWYNGGAFTAIGAVYSSGGWATNDVGVIEALGGGFFGYQNGTLRVSGYNASTPTTGRPGIVITDTTGRIDDFEGGDCLSHIADTATRFTGSSSPLTQAFTCAAGTSVLVLDIVTLGAVDRAGGAPTYNGVALTQVGTVQKAASSPEVGTELWYLIAPTTGSSLTISVPNTGSKTLYCYASSWKVPTGYTSAIDQINGANNTSANPSPGAITPTVNGDLVYAVLGAGNNSPVSGRSHILLNETDTGNQTDNRQYLIQPTAGAVTMSWTLGSDDWGSIVASFKLVAVPSGQTKTFTVDGIVLVTTTSTFTADGIVLVISTKTFTTDGIVLAITSQTFTADGIVLAVTTKTFTVDGLVLATTSNTFTVDGIVQATQTKTFTVDGIVLVVTSVTFTVDGIVFAVNTKTFTVDGVVVIKFSELRDNFNDNSLSAPIWTNWGGSKVLEQNQRLEIFSANSGGNGYFGLDTDLFYDLTADSVSVQLVNAGNQGITSWGVWPIQLRLNGTNNVNWSVQAGTIRATKQVGGVDTHLYETTYSAVTHQFLRIRESGGTIYWDSSEDGISWTNRASNTTPFAIQSLQYQVFVGTWQNEVGTTVAYIDNVNVNAYTNTFTVDGIVLAVTDKTFTVDGIVLVTTTATFTTDAVILETGNKTFTVDGVVLAVTTTTFTVDGIVLATQTNTFTIDGIVLVSTTKTFTVDGVILETTVYTFTIDAVILAEGSKTFTGDGIVLAVTTNTFTADGIIFATNTATFTVDAIVHDHLIAWYDTSQLTGLVDDDLITSLTDFSVNGFHATGSDASRPTYKTGIQNGLPIARLAGSQGRQLAANPSPAESTFDLSTYTIFVVAKKSGGGNGTLISKNTTSTGAGGRRKIQMILTGTTLAFSAGSDANSISKTATTSVFSLFAVIGRANNDHDLVVNRSLTNITTTIDDTTFNDARVEIGQAFSNGAERLTGDIGEIKVYDYPMTVSEFNTERDALIEKWALLRVYKTFTTDGIVLETKTASITADGIIVDRITNTFTIDGLIFSANTTLFTIDGIVLATTNNSFTVDGIVLETKTTTLTVDGLIQTASNLTFTADGIVQATISTTFTADAVVQAIIGVVFTVDGVVLEQGAKTFTVDGIVLVQTQLQYTVDAIVRETITNQYTADGIVLVQTSKTFTVDGIVLTIVENQFTVDAIIRSGTLYQFTADGIILSRIQTTFTADGIVLTTGQLPLTVDGVVNEEQTKTVMVDGIVLATTTIQFTVNGSIVATHDLTFTTDGFIFATNETSFSADGIVINKLGPVGGSHPRRALWNEKDAPKGLYKPVPSIHDPREVPTLYKKHKLDVWGG